jgi:hypothetical protein
MKRPSRPGSSYKGHPETSRAGPSGQRTLTESLPPIQAKAIARLAAAGEARAASIRAQAVRVAEMEASVKDRVRTFLFEHAWASDTLIDDDGEYEQMRDATLALFTGKELAVHYVGGGEDHTLNELIHMLFDPAASGRRTDAASFLSPITG